MAGVRQFDEAAAMEAAAADWRVRTRGRSLREGVGSAAAPPAAARLRGAGKGRLAAPLAGQGSGAHQLSSIWRERMVENSSANASCAPVMRSASVASLL